jgi:hypothetical protein
VRERALPSPPGVRLATLPRGAADKPQETAVTVNPRDPRNVIVSYHQAMGEGSDHHPKVQVHVHLAWTADGGETWTVAENTTHPDYGVSIDATVAFDLHGQAFLVYMGMDRMTPVTRGWHDRRDRVAQALRRRDAAALASIREWVFERRRRAGEYILRSLDGGRTWEGPVALAAEPGAQVPVLNHMPHIAADNHPASPDAGNIYVVWDRQTYEAGDPGALLMSEVILVRSTDGGETWSEPRAISTHDTELGLTTAVAHDGTVYVMVAEMRDGDWEIKVERSRDRGETFESLLPVARAILVPGHTGVSDVANFPRAWGCPVLAIDPRGSGRLFVVFGDHRNGDRDVFCTSSDNGGQTWTEPARVNDDPQGNGKDQTMQWLAVDPTDGAAYVIFYDRRADPDNLLATVTLARSTDAGHTWVNYAWTNTASDPMRACLGDYLGLAALDGRVYGAWPENAPAPHEAEPGETVVDDTDFPSGPTAIRVGIADFRIADGATRQRAGSRS